MAGDATASSPIPIQKEATLFPQASGIRAIRLSGSARDQASHRPHEVMMLVARDLRAVPLTVHIPFKDVRSPQHQA